MNNIDGHDNGIFSFTAKIDIIGINPFVFVPEKILKEVFKQAKKEKGHIPIKGEANGKAYKQTLVKYGGDWRLYINMEMVDNSPKKIGKTIHMTVTYDDSDRTMAPHPKLTKAFESAREAQNVFQNLSRSKQQEIIKYFSYLKTEESIDRNIKRAIDFLLGKGRFVGRDKP